MSGELLKVKIHDLVRWEPTPPAVPSTPEHIRLGELTRGKYFSHPVCSGEVFLTSPDVHRDHLLNYRV